MTPGETLTSVLFFAAVQHLSLGAFLASRGNGKGGYLSISGPATRRGRCGSVAWQPCGKSERGIM
jgi:hypothetical protein